MKEKVFLERKSERLLMIQKEMASLYVGPVLCRARSVTQAGGQDHVPVLCSGAQLFFFSPSANLSDLYFTNRQDRYVLLRDSPEIADFFTELVDAIGDVSLQLQRDDTVQMMEGMVHPYQGRRGPLTRTPSIGKC